MTAAARWARAHYGDKSVEVTATGPRTSTVALVAGAIDADAVGAVTVRGAFGSLKQLIEENRSVEQMPEQFSFGLLEAFDLKHIAALVAPRPVHFAEPGSRVKAEMAGLKAWYATLGGAHDPLSSN